MSKTLPSYNPSYTSSTADKPLLGMAIGVKRGDRVGIWSPNRYEWTVTQFATAKVGAILVNINPAYGVHELQYALNLAGITTLVTADSFKASNYREMIYEQTPERAAV